MWQVCFGLTPSWLQLSVYFPHSCFCLVLNWTASQCFIHQQTLPFPTGHTALTRVTDARWQPNIDWRPTYSLVCQGLKGKVTLHVSPANIHSIFNSTEVCKMNKFKLAFPDLVPSLAGNNHLLFNFNLQIYMVDHLKHCEMEMLLSYYCYVPSFVQYWTPRLQTTFHFVYILLLCCLIFIYYPHRTCDITF